MNTSAKVEEKKIAPNKNVTKESENTKTPQKKIQSDQELNKAMNEADGVNL